MKTTARMWEKVRGPVIGSVMVMALAAVLVPSGHAASVAGNSSTYLQSREGADNTTLLPVYEYLDLAVKDVGSTAVSIHLGGWFGFDLADSSFGDNKKRDSDLQYGYVSYRAKENNVLVNLGRVMVFEGVATERVDGVYARTDIKGGFGIAAFGGSPVETGTDQPGNNVAYGARVSHQKAGLYTVGLSYIKEEKDNSTFREEEGLDLWVRPVNKVELMGRSSYNADFTGWMEHAYFLVLGPFDKLRFNTDYSWINYDAYFAGMTTNVFEFKPGGPIDPKEKVNILGEEVVYAISKNWNASIDYKAYNYDIAGTAAYYGAKVTYVMPKAYSAGAAVHRMDGGTSRLQYDEYRVYAARKMHQVDVALDLIDIKYKEPIYTVSNAFSATIAAGYEVTQKLKVGLDLEYAKNPDFDKDVRAFAKVVYSFDVSAGSPKKASAGTGTRGSAQGTATFAAATAPESGMRKEESK